MVTTWAELKHTAIEAFNGELPNALTEQEIVTAFEQEPEAVLVALHAVIEAFKAGKCRSGWAVWKSRIQTVTSTPDVTVETSNRPKLVKLAEAWIRQAGGHLDRAEELQDALFGHHGSLKAWADDQILVDRMVALWYEQRPRFVTTELEAEKRQREHADRQHRLRKASEGALTPAQADEHAARIAAEVQRAKEAFAKALEDDDPWGDQT
jgi:hypothetical protein